MFYRKTIQWATGIIKLYGMTDMMKKDLQAQAQISWASVTKMSKNENVSMDILLKVCESLNCGIEDIVEFVPDSDME